MPEYPIEIECGCDKKKKFPYVVQAEEGKPEGSKTRELECPLCGVLLTVTLPTGTVPRDTTLYRGLKKGG